MNEPTPDIETQLQILREMGKLELQEQWRRVYRTQPPASFRLDLLLQAIAYKLQEQMFGGLSTAAQRQLRTWTAKMNENGQQPQSQVITLKPGAQLLREWHGQTYQVLVVENGFNYEGQYFSALSQIARKITGTRWSGPRFFGLKRPVNPFAKQKEIYLENLDE
ncbi:MAG: DUF2924 domain-containing protein [Candidatus Thiodiazotropha taylori]|nr:DUF2924 domain-containing protein [Candidatus Thiodiazotropha taylori]